MLRPDTDRVWNFLKEQSSLSGFVLIGGSALALRIKHRVSEDLDFACLEEKLPRGKLDVLRRVAEQNNIEFQQDDDEAAVEDFVSGGMELHDYQQDYLVDRKVKVSFFTPEKTLKKVVNGGDDTCVRLATVEELFKTKCLVSALRSKTRDWLDLYVLLRDHGFTIRDYYQAFVDADVVSQCDIGLSRLCAGVVSKGDEGYSHLLSDAPSLEQMTEFFVDQRNRLEVELAREKAREDG